MFITIGQPGAELAHEYTLAVTALSDLPENGVAFETTDRAHLVTSELDLERVRQYVTKIVQNCPDVPESEAHTIFERYFDADQPASAAPHRSSRHVQVRAFDPPWLHSDNDLTFTFGVADRVGGPDAELSVNAVTPAGLVARADQGGFILSHRATILTAVIDVKRIQQRIVDTVATCSRADLDVALLSLQRYYRLAWETSLSRRIEV